MTRRVRTGGSFRRWQTCRNLGLGQVDQRVVSMTQGDSRQSQCRSKCERNAKPGDTAEEESLDGRCRLGCDRSLVVGLIVEDGSEVSGKGKNPGSVDPDDVFLNGKVLPNDVDHTEDQTVLAPHGQVTTMCISGNWVFLSGDAEHRVHLAERAD
jgi:hypothetical protein